MKKSLIILAVVLSAGWVAGCEGARKSFVERKAAPDEFAIYTRAPLSMPPDYGLRPPEPGAPRPRGLDPKNQAKSAILGRPPAPKSSQATAPAANVSVGLQALLKNTGAAQATPDIRMLVNRETSTLAVEDKSFTEKIMFWGTPAEYGTVVDSKKENRRIMENQALDKPITKGKTPTIKRKRRAILEGIFN